MVAEPAGPQRAAVGYKQGVLLVLIAGTCWSIVGIGIRLISDANVWQILFYRSLALVPFLFVVMGVRSGGRPIDMIVASGRGAIYGGLALLCAFASSIYAIQTTSVANAMFLFAAAPLWAAVLGRVLLGEPVRRVTWIAIGFAILGIAIMAHAGLSTGNYVGDAVALLSGIGFAGFAVALRSNTTGDMMPAVFLAGIFATVVAAVVCLVSGYSLLLSTNDTVIALGLGVFQLGLGLTLFTIGSRAVPAAELALLAMMEVVLGPVWVWLFLGETAPVTTLVGGAVLLSALAWNAVSGVRR